MAGNRKGKDSLLANGHAKLNQAVQQIEEDIYQEENIFLFLPNVIGTLAPNWFLSDPHLTPTALQGMLESS